MTPTCYEKDFAQWSFDTARAIRERRFDCIDWENVAEEIETLGRSERRDLVSRLSQLIYHLLKREHQPEHKTRNWERTIRDQRLKVYEHVAPVYNPSEDCGESTGTLNLEAAWSQYPVPARGLDAVSMVRHVAARQAVIEERENEPPEKELDPGVITDRQIRQLRKE